MYLTQSNLVQKLTQVILDATSANTLLSKSLLLRSNGSLEIQGQSFDLSQYKRIIAIGAGKASIAMAEALEDLFKPSGQFKIHDGAVISSFKRPHSCKRIKVLKGNHPFVGQDTLESTQILLSYALHLDPEDLVIVLLSGGGSSLLEQWKPGVSTDQIQNQIERLLRSGANISEINQYRKSVSALKNGGLARICQPATVISLILSDVSYDPISTVASGPTNLLGEKTHHFVIGDYSVALDALQFQLESMGFRIDRDSNDPFNESADEIAAQAVDWVRSASGKRALLRGGESLVKVRGSGRGGRNQELVLSALCKLKTSPGEFLILSMGTDGVDGPTDAAGAYIDSTTFKVTQEKGLDPQKFLKENDSNTFFNQTQTLIKTGPTNTNVMDVVVAIRFS